MVDTITDVDGIGANSADFAGDPNANRDRLKANVQSVSTSITALGDGVLALENAMDAFEAAVVAVDSTSLNAAIAVII